MTKICYKTNGRLVEADLSPKDIQALFDAALRVYNGQKDSTYSVMDVIDIILQKKKEIKNV